MHGFNFLHISDLHFQIKNSSNDPQEKQEEQRKRGMEARRALANDINEGRLGYKVFDYIFITGDIFYKGVVPEDLANDPLLCALKKAVPDDGYPHIFWCCGNHDIINDADDLNKLEEYHKNYKKVTGCDLPEDADSLHWFRRTKNMNLLILNTNSKSASYDKVEVINSKNEDTEISDKVQINCDSLQKILKKHDKSLPTIVIGHHGLNWFSKDNQILIAKLFESYDVDFYLCGHDHRLGYSQIDYSGKGIHQITCGGCLHDGYAIFSVVCGEYKNMLYHLTPYKYNLTGNGRWAEDFNLHRKLAYNNVFMRANIETSFHEILWNLWESPEVNSSGTSPTDIVNFLRDVLEETIQAMRGKNKDLDTVKELFKKFFNDFMNINTAENSLTKKINMDNL